MIQQYIDKYIYLKSCDSTNDYAAKVLSISNPNQNYCIYTFDQQDGKGQIGRKWYCGQDQNIALSFLLELGYIKVRDQFGLNMAVALSVRDAMVDFIDPAFLTIKWPNDIYYKNQKLGGILIQNQIKGKQISHTIVGIGLNVNESQFPADLPNPISLYQIRPLNEKYNKLMVIQNLTEKLSKRLSMLLLHPSKVKEEYCNHLYRLGRKHDFIKEGVFFSGTITDISEDGKLCVDTSDGVQYFGFREIQYVI